MIPVRFINTRARKDGFRNHSIQYYRSARSADGQRKRSLKTSLPSLVLGRISPLNLYRVDFYALGYFGHSQDTLSLPLISLRKDFLLRGQIGHNP